MKRRIEKIYFCLALLFAFLLIVCTIELHSLVYFNREMNQVRAQLQETEADVEAKLRVNEDVTRAIVEGQNGGW